MYFSIAYLEDNSEVREVICALIEVKLKVSCLELSHFSDLIKNSEAVLKTKIVILDLELGRNQPNGVEAFKWLLDHNYQGQVYFLTGHGKDIPSLIEAEKRGAVVLEKPLSTDDMLDLFPKYLSSETSGFLL